MALQEYARLVLFLDGTYIRELSSLDVEWDSGQQPVNLLVEGLAGFTPGTGVTTVNIGFMVPIGGPEYDYVSRLVAGQQAALQMGIGSKSYAANGKFTNVKISQSTGASVEGSATWMGEHTAPV